MATTNETIEIPREDYDNIVHALKQARNELRSRMETQPSLEDKPVGKSIDYALSNLCKATSALAHYDR